MVAVLLLTLISDDMHSPMAPSYSPLTPLITASKRIQNNSNGNPYLYMIKHLPFITLWLRYIFSHLLQVI